VWHPSCRAFRPRQDPPPPRHSPVSPRASSIINEVRKHLSGFVAKWRRSIVIASVQNIQTPADSYVGWYYTSAAKCLWWYKNSLQRSRRQSETSAKIYTVSAMC
jgi:hypothetical protein